MHFYIRTIRNRSANRLLKLTAQLWPNPDPCETPLYFLHRNGSSVNPWSMKLVLYCYRKGLQSRAFSCIPRHFSLEAFLKAWGFSADSKPVFPIVLQVSYESVQYYTQLVKLQVWKKLEASKNSEDFRLHGSKSQLAAGFMNASSQANSRGSADWLWRKHILYCFPMFTFSSAGSRSVIFSLQTISYWK